MDFMVTPASTEIVKPTQKKLAGLGYFCVTHSSIENLAHGRHCT